MPAKARPKLKPGSPAALVRDAAEKFGATVESVVANTFYVWAPPGKTWASDPECHVFMVTDYYPEDTLRIWLPAIEAGLVDCPEPDCEFCNRVAIAERKAAERASLDSACL